MSEKISQMPTATALSGAELVPVVQSGDNKKTTTQDIADLAGGGGAINSVAESFSINSGELNANWWYNVKDYGAVGDGVTDDSAAIQAAINACHEALGGTVFFPIGVYIVANTLSRTVTNEFGELLCNSQIYIPFVQNDAAANEYRTVRLLGESPSSNESQVVAEFPNPMNGAIIKSTYITADDDPGGFSKNVIGALSKGNNVFASWNYTICILQDITVLVSTQTSLGVETRTKMCGVSFEYVASARLLGNVKIRTTSPPEDQLDPYPQSIGYIGPLNNNHANCCNERVYSAGFEVGIRVSEHSTFQEIMLHANRYGIEVMPYYKVIVGSLIAENNGYILKMHDQSNIAITGWSGEKNTTPGKYYSPVVDVIEATSNARGTVTVQHLTINNTGLPTYPTVSGPFISLISIADQYGHGRLFRRVTAAQASAVTPFESLILFVTTTDATFTSVGYWSYENAAWHKM